MAVRKIKGDWERLREEVEASQGDSFRGVRVPSLSYHRGKPGFPSADFQRAREDLSHRGPEAWKRQSYQNRSRDWEAPSSKEEMVAYLKELEEGVEALRAFFEENPWDFAKERDSWKDLGELGVPVYYCPSLPSPFREFVAWYTQASEEEIEAWRITVMNRNLHSGSEMLRHEGILAEAAARLRKKEEE